MRTETNGLALAQGEMTIDLAIPDPPSKGALAAGIQASASLSSGVSCYPPHTSPQRCFAGTGTASIAFSATMLRVEIG